MTNYFRTMAVGIVLTSFTPAACLPADRESTPAAVTDLSSQEQDVQRAAEPAADIYLESQEPATAVTPLASQEQDAQRFAELPHFGGLIDKCVALQETAVPQVRPSSWRTYAALEQWSNEEVTQVSVNVISPSDDWARADDYCFDQDGNIAGLYSVLSIFNAIDTKNFDITNIETIFLEVIRTWKYHPDGSIESLGTGFFDLFTGEPIASDDVSYMDRPPHMATNYKDLDEYLGLPTLQ